MRCLECGQVGMSIRGNCITCGSFAMFVEEQNTTTEAPARESFRLGAFEEWKRIFLFLGGTNMWGLPCKKVVPKGIRLSESSVKEML